MTYTPQHDLNHNYVSPDHRYACYNKPNSRVTRAWLNTKMRRGLQIIDSVTTEWLDVGCAHSYRSTDPSCTDCKWR